MVKNVLGFGIVLWMFICSLSSYSQVRRSPLVTKGAIKQSQWVDSIYSSLSWNERIGQLFMVAAYSNGSAQHQKDIEKLIKDYKIGGLIFMQGDPVRQAHLTNKFQSISDMPLLIGQDMEWGLNMRLDSTLRYPNQLTLGAIQHDSLIYEMGADIARQMKTMGIHLNFAPVVDINSNPDNPVIGYRSFGEDRDNVARKAAQYMKGMQDQGVLACAKHFPGHGDTSADSHHTLPTVNKSKEELKSTELYPFGELINDEVSSIMSAHLNVPAIDTASIPSSLSKKAITELLRNEMNFEGLVITDALNMKGATETFPSGKLEVVALDAGNDILLFSQNVPLAIKSLRKALRKRQLKREQVETAVKKILSAKYKVGLNMYTPVNTENLIIRLHEPESEVLINNLYQSSITVGKNEGNLLPFLLPDTTSFASLSLNSSTNEFHSMLQKYAPFKVFKHEKGGIPPVMLQQLSKYEVVVIGLFGLNNSPRKNFGLKSSDIEFITQLAKKTKVVLNVFGNPYALSSFENIDHLLCAYQHNKYTETIIPQVLFGALAADGQLPVSSSNKLKVETGINLRSIDRIAFATPDAVGMDRDILNKIDIIAHEAIIDQATPGCQILVARNGKVVFDKAYGHHTYDSLRSVTPETLYDIASITKVAASLQAVMFMEEKGLIDLDKKISHYLTDLKGSNKEYMTIRDILSHQAGLWPYLPFWKQTMNSEEHLPEFYNHEPQDEFPYFVSQGLYTTKDIRESVWQWVIESKLRDKEEDEPYGYKYSDMGYYMMHRLAEEVLNQPMEEFLADNLYEPLGLQYLGYNPLNRFSKHQITPTEADSTFRMSQIHGTVHDQGAALFGGVAGHAGLFSNARDLATLMQMHLQGGKYAGHQYLKKETLEKFTVQQYKNYNRRGAGWDKPLSGAWYGPTSGLASKDTFGHTGFTGTAVWADPEFDLVFVFLSNRIYPNANNRKLISNNIRTRIQDLVYQSIFEYDKYH